MVALIFLCLNLVASLLKSRGRLEAENAALRHQLIVLQRKVRGLAAHIPADVRLPVLVALIVAAEGSGDSPDIEAVNRLASKLMGDAENLAKTVSRTAKPELRAVE